MATGSAELTIAGTRPTTARLGGEKRARAGPHPLRSGVLRTMLHLAVTLIAIAVIAFLVPRSVHAGWSTVATSVTTISGPAVGLLLAVWGVGLVAHAIMLAAALPGLSHRRALLLSLTGGAVANSLPLGGAAGIALNRRMTREWGFSGTQFAAYTVVTHAWELFAKTVLPVAALPLLAFIGAPASGAVPIMAGPMLVAPIAGGAVALVLFGRVLTRTTHRLLSRPRTSRSRLRAAVARALTRCESVRTTSAGVASRHWKRLSAGMTLSTALLFTLLVVSLESSGAGVPIAYVFLAFCCERMITLIGLTPGAIGFTEMGLMTALMLAPTAHGAGVAAGVLIYRTLTFGLRIPLGATLLLVWVGHVRRRGVPGSGAEGGAGRS